MPLLFIVLCIVAAVLARGTATFSIAVVNAIAIFWSNGVLANYRDDPHAAPNWAAAVSMITTVIGVVLLIVALVIR